MAIDYFSQLNALARDYVGTLTPNDFAVYMRLLFLDNNLHWEEWFTTTYERLCIETCIKKADTIQTIINRLEQRGFIEVRRGGKHKPNFYKILPIYKNYPDEKDNLRDNLRDNSRDNLRDNLRDNSRDVNKTKTKKETETKTNKGADVFAGESERVKEALRAFVEMRQKMRKPMTDRAKEILLHKLEGLSGGDEFIKIQLLEQSIERGWLSVFPLDMNQKPKLSTGNPQSNPQDDIAKAIAFFESQEGTA